MCINSKYIFDNTFLFEKQLDSYLANNDLTGKYVVFSNNKIYAIADTMEKAYQLAVGLFSDEPFLIRKVSENKEIEEIMENQPVPLAG